LQLLIPKNKTMKHFIRSFFAAALTVLLFAQCSKGRTTYNGTFWTSKDTSEVRLFLFVDDEYKGEVPFLEKAPECSAENALSFPVESGQHTLVARDVNGTIRSSGTVKIKSNARRSSTSVSGGSGGQDIYLNDDCLIVKLYY
jgi:hypothetical protein